MLSSKTTPVIIGNINEINYLKNELNFKKILTKKTKFKKELIEIYEVNF